MKIPITFLFICFLQVTGAARALAIDDAMLTPTQMLAETYLTEDLNLVNGNNIYRRIAAICDKPVFIRSRVIGMSSSRVSVAWATNARADGREVVATLRNGTSILQAFMQVSKLRSEQIINANNYLIVLGSADLGPVKTYQVGKREESEKYLKVLIPNAISLIEPDADSFEQFFNYKLEQSSRFIGNEGAGDLKCHLDAFARTKIEAVNLIGNWTFRDAFDVVCRMTGLCWGIEGKMIVFKKETGE